MPIKKDSLNEERKSNGWGAVARRQAILEEKQKSLDTRPKDFFLMAGESAVVQFLQDEPYCFDAHRVKDKRGNWTIVPCQLNTGKHCLMCTQGVKLTWQAAFKVLDYRGSWDKDKKCFKNDEPVEKIWKVGSVLANQLKQLITKKGKDLTEMVLEVSRSGQGKDATYNFEQAFDDDDKKLRPITYKEKFPSTEECCQPPTDDEIDARGLTSGD